MVGSSLFDDHSCFFPHLSWMLWALTIGVGFGLLLLPTNIRLKISTFLPSHMLLRDIYGIKSNVCFGLVGESKIIRQDFDF